jgi:hypothetical protein
MAVYRDVIRTTDTNTTTRALVGHSGVRGNAVRRIALFSAFVLGVLAKLAVLSATGGFYEYRCATPAASRELINTGHWEPAPLTSQQQQIPCLYLRRPRVQLP